MIRKKYQLFFICVFLFLLPGLLVAQVTDDLEKAFERGDFDGKLWRNALSKDANLSLSLAKLYQIYNRTFIKKYGRNEEIEDLFAQLMSKDAKKALWENLLWQSNFNGYLSDEIENAANVEENYGEAHYLFDLNFLLNPENSENAQEILERTDAAMKFRDNFRFTAIIRNAAKRINLKYRVVEADYFDYLLKKTTNLIDDITFKARWVAHNDGEVFNKMDTRTKSRLKKLLFHQISRTIFANPALDTVNTPAFPGTAGNIVMFFNTDCHFCKSEIALLSKAKFRKKQLILINTQYQNPETVKKDTMAFIEELQVKFPVFIDRENVLAEQLGFSGLPVFLYVPPAGKNGILFEMKIPENTIEKLNWLTDMEVMQ